MCLVEVEGVPKPVSISRSLINTFGKTAADCFMCYSSQTRSQSDHDFGKNAHCPWVSSNETIWHYVDPMIGVQRDMFL